MAVIFNLHLKFLSRAENNWMSHLLTQLHSANYPLVVILGFFSLYCVLSRINICTGEIIVKAIK